MLHIDPAMIQRLDEIKDDLITRRELAESKGWLVSSKASTSPSNSYKTSASTHTASSGSVQPISVCRGSALKTRRNHLPAMSRRAATMLFESLLPATPRGRCA